MTWPADRAACYGLACNQHGTCERYAAVDHNSNPQQVFVDNCGPEHPLYIPIVPAVAPVEVRPL